MECEVCGKPIFKPLRVAIEGTEMKVCKACAKFGERIKAVPGQRSKLKKKTPQRPKEPTTEVVGEYPEIIRQARERKRLTQEQLGNRINEKASVINRLEAGRMSPSIPLAKKLEKALEVTLLEEVREASPSGYGTDRGENLTIGDIIKVKREK